MKYLYLLDAVDPYYKKSSGVLNSIYIGIFIALVLCITAVIVIKYINKKKK